MKKFLSRKLRNVFTHNIFSPYGMSHQTDLNFHSLRMWDDIVLVTESIYTHATFRQFRCTSLITAHGHQHTILLYCNVLYFI